MPLRALAVFAMPASVAAAVVGIIGFLIWWPLIVLAVPVFALVGWFLWQRSDDAVLAAVDARPLGQSEGERIRNIVERLCLSHGFAQPDLAVIDTSGRNLLSIEGRRTTIVATTGLLEALDPIELEGAAAHALSKLADGFGEVETWVASAPWAVPAPLRQRVLSDHDNGVVRFDIAGAELTRYPPGLRAALDKLRDATTEIAGGTALGAAWLVPPLATELPLESRIEVLGEL